MKRFDITGMSCSACVSRVEKAVTGVDGVQKCSVSLLTNSMLVEGIIDDEVIISAVKGAGYGAIRAEDVTATDERFADKESPALIKRLIWSIGFLLALMYLSMGHVMWSWPLPSFLSDPITIALLELILALIVMVINRKFFISGAKAIINRSPNMDTLVALGSGVSFLYSTYIFAQMLFSQSPHGYLHGLYFESAGMIVTLITVGKLLEAKAKGRTTSALKALMDLSPKYATIIKDGEEITIKARELCEGDIFVVRNGESIPADGIIIDGMASIDESSLTGESVPADKAEGGEVSASTICTSGFIKCRAERTGADTTISQIIKTVADATSTKAPIAKIADKVSGFFVPAIITIAVLVMIIWLVVGEGVGYAIGRAISVLVISCPCALGLATPVAIMVGSGVGAKNGVLFKTAQALEETGRAKIVAFDKTGTLTSGEMRVSDIIPYGISEDELLCLAYSLEEKSEHPLGRAIVKYAKERESEYIEGLDFKAHAGEGVRAIIKEEIALGGKADFIAKHAGIPDDALKMASSLAEQGKTPLYFAKNGAFVGIIAISDTIKPSSKEAVAWLKSNGLRVVMITGDNEHTARAVAGEVGIDEVIAGVLPNEKQSEIKALGVHGKTIMVGDGVNDAPALAEASVGIAIGAGTDVAIDTAEVVVMKSDLISVCNAIRLGRATLKNVKENLFWAFFYNVIAIPIAAGALAGVGLTLSPMLGALAMSLSSVCVVTNALRLNFFKALKGSSEPTDTEEDDMVTVIKVSGMMCPHCEARVKEALEKIEGVEKASPSHKKGLVKVKFDAPADISTIKSTIAEAGYKVE
ncbi:MAG: heavy metal translocating P-type ATPase [Clostridia bacterium]|nr:heavy metal translocating P-type ATPase [Clostridia bacterium]